MIHSNQVHKMIHQRAVVKARSEGRSSAIDAEAREAYDGSSIAKIISHECKTMIQYVFHNRRGKSSS